MNTLQTKIGLNVWQLGVMLIPYSVFLIGYLRSPEYYRELTSISPLLCCVVMPVFLMQLLSAVLIAGKEKFSPFLTIFLFVSSMLLTMTVFLGPAIMTILGALKY